MYSNVLTALDQRITLLKIWVRRLRLMRGFGPAPDAIF
jgi:hypothetical protein